MPARQPARRRRYECLATVGTVAYVFLVSVAAYYGYYGLLRFLGLFVLGHCCGYGDLAA